MSTNIDVSVNSVHVIRILSNDVQFLKNWKLFALNVRIGTANMHDLEKLENSRVSISEIIMKLMMIWKSISSTDANSTTLASILMELNCNKCAGEITALLQANNSQHDFTSRMRELSIQGDSLLANNKLLWFNIRSPTKYYFGRENEMQEIQQQWEECLKQKTMSIIAITGFGGIGKSEIAKNYAKRFYEHVQGHCIWIDAETSQSVLKSFQDLAKEINISILDSSGKEKELKILIEEIFAKLSLYKRLIIFDNIETYETPVMKQLYELASRQPPNELKPFLMTTSRFRPAFQFFGDKCTALNLKVLSKESAVRLFFKSLQMEANEVQGADLKKDIETLCERLQYYPLAMQQALAYIKGNIAISDKNPNDIKRVIQSYQMELEKETKVAFDRPLPRCETEEDNPKTTYVTWQITIDKIKSIPHVGPAAIQMLNIISFLSPDNISIELISKISRKLQTTQINASNENLIQLLIDYCMVEISGYKIRLVQEVIRMKLAERKECNDLLDKLRACIMDMIEARDFAVDQMHNAERVWQHLSTNGDLREKCGEFSVWISWKYKDAGKYREGLNFCSEALKVLKSTSAEENKWTLRLQFWKALLLRQLGQYSDSLELLLTIHDEQVKLFGERDLFRLQTAGEIGYAQYLLGSSAEAVKWCETTLEKQMEVSGKEDPSTLDLQSSMALVLDQQGKYGDALTLYNEVLAVRERKWGKEHPETLTIKHNIALVLLSQRKYEEALRLFKEVVEVRERVQELNHPHTLSSKYFIADTYDKLGRRQEATQLAQEVYEKLVEVLGHQHPNTIATKEFLERLQFTKTNKWKLPFIHKLLERIF